MAQLIEHDDDHHDQTLVCEPKRCAATGTPFAWFGDFII